MLIGSIKPKLKEVLLEARRWTDSYGNTYHVVDVYANGKYLDSSKITYGYGSSYEQTAANILTKNGYYPRALSKPVSYWRFFKDKGIKFTSRVKDVKRKRDL